MPRPWTFVGRKRELDALHEIFSAGRWFFVKIAGRRRIGKSTMVRHALQETQRGQAVYFQIPDGDPGAVLAASREFLAESGVAARPSSLLDLARVIERLIRDGAVVVLDEFQYFHRKALHEFTSHLQYSVDRLQRDAGEVRGGLCVLGSIHTEMSALLEDRDAPLFSRLTASLDLGHLEVASVLEILRRHADPSPERLLFLWNLFEGVPKFYRDSYESGTLGADRRALLSALFFNSAAPLRTEADQWFLKELRGRYDLVLKYIATHPGCSSGELEAHARDVQPDLTKQVGAYLRVLKDRYQMVELLQPVLAPPKSRRGRLYVRDNFLRSWLSAIALPAAMAAFREPEEVVARADERLAVAEGHGLERLVRALYHERGRRGLGDLALSRPVEGYWDRAGAEIDLVALDEDARVVRLGSCKRNPDRLISDRPSFEGHVARFLARHPRFEGWRVEKVGVAPHIDGPRRRALVAEGWEVEDLESLCRGLP